MNPLIDPQRRHILQLIASAPFALGAIQVVQATPTSEVATMSNVNPVPDTAATLKPLPFDPTKLKGLSERLIRSHWENNYGGSVKALAVTRKHLAEALAAPDMPPYLYNELKREHLLRTGSVVLHELYFDNLGGSDHADSGSRTTIADAFGSFDAWETEFRRMGLGLGGGSGWVVLGFNTHTRRLENYWMSDHAHGPVATQPILVMDMYEHSYQMDYGAAAAKYVDAFFQNIQWEAVARRLEAHRVAA
jgi:Fe-Mn family superoxide dismutase